MPSYRPDKSERRLRKRTIYITGGILGYGKPESDSPIRLTVHVGRIAGGGPAGHRGRTSGAEKSLPRENCRVPWQSPPCSATRRGWD